MYLGSIEVSEIYFFFKQKTSYDVRMSDWSSDVCSSDLLGHQACVPVAGERERGVGRDLGHEVVVVGVEPLRHLQRRMLTGAAGGGEVRPEGDGAILAAQLREAVGQGADSDSGVEHLVVVRERLRNRGVVAAEPEGGESLPCGAAKGRSEEHTSELQ